MGGRAGGEKPSGLTPVKGDREGGAVDRRAAQLGGVVLGQQRRPSCGVSAVLPLATSYLGRVWPWCEHLKVRPLGAVSQAASSEEGLLKGHVSGAPHGHTCLPKLGHAPVIPIVTERRSFWRTHFGCNYTPRDLCV